MGFYASADVVFGVPVETHDDYTGDPTPFWDENNDDFIEIPTDVSFELHTYGYHNSPDGPLAILRLKNTLELSAYAGDQIQIDLADMELSACGTDINKATQEAQALNLPVDFNDAKWYLVASYG